MCVFCFQGICFPLVRQNAHKPLQRVALWDMPFPGRRRCFFAAFRALLASIKKTAPQRRTSLESGGPGSKKRLLGLPKCSADGQYQRPLKAFAETCVARPVIAQRLQSVNLEARFGTCRCQVGVPKASRLAALVTIPWTLALLC